MLNEQRIISGPSFAITLDESGVVRKYSTQGIGENFRVASRCRMKRANGLRGGQKYAGGGVAGEFGVFVSYTKDGNTYGRQLRSPKILERTKG